jgi:2-iminobutanoate/2-iminopropanoate deaminase
MMKKSIISTLNAPAAVGTYSQGVRWGDFYFFSGQIGIEPKSGLISPDFDAQLEQILQNIDALLESVDLSRNNIIKTTIFMTDLALFSKVNAAYENFFPKPFPARSCVEVSKLPKDAKIEIEVIAAKE